MIHFVDGLFQLMRLQMENSFAVSSFPLRNVSKVARSFLAFLDPHYIPCPPLTCEFEALIEGRHCFYLV